MSKYCKCKNTYTKEECKCKTPEYWKQGVGALENQGSSNVNNV